MINSSNVITSQIYQNHKGTHIPQAGAHLLHVISVGEGTSSSTAGKGTTILLLRKTRHGALKASSPAASQSFKHWWHVALWFNHQLCALTACQSLTDIPSGLQDNSQGSCSYYPECTEEDWGLSCPPRTCILTKVSHPGKREKIISSKTHFHRKTYLVSNT